MANFNVDVLRRAKTAGIPTLKAKVVMEPDGSYSVEMRELRKPGHDLVDGSRLDEYAKENNLRNLKILKRGIGWDIGILKGIGLQEDPSHLRHSAWVVDVNRETGIGRRYLVDATNLMYIQGWQSKQK